MEIVLKKIIIDAVKSLYNSEVPENLVQIQETKKDFKGDFTVVVFPLLRYSKNTPEKTGSDIGEFLVKNSDLVSEYNVIKGFLNLVISDSWWLQLFTTLSLEKDHKENFKP